MFFKRHSIFVQQCLILIIFAAAVSAITPVDESEHIDTLRANVIAHALGEDVPYALPEPNACNVLVNTHCPLELNEIGKYKLEMHISVLYPKIALGLTMSLKANGKKEDLVCFNIQGQVV